MSVQKVSAAGTSIWLDDLSRAKITSTEAHALPARISNSGVVGVTTNPSIFSAAISGAAEYAADIAAMKSAPVDEVVKKLTTDDVRQACDLFTSLYQTTHGVDGRVSIEVDPRLAHDTEGTIAAGKELWSIIDRPNVMIKVPATLEGLPAITALIAAGISVNVTLIFSVKRYGQVIEAYMKGIEQCEDPTQVHSVASFFISRIDSSIDALLKKNASPEAAALLGKAAIANAHLAYQLFEEKFASERWNALASKGRNTSSRELRRTSEVVGCSFACMICSRSASPSSVYINTRSGRVSIRSHIVASCGATSLLRSLPKRTSRTSLLEYCLIKPDGEPSAIIAPLSITTRRSHSCSASSIK